MIPAAGVTALDDVDVVDDSLSIFMAMSDGSIVAVCLPIAELIRRGHTVVDAAAAPAFRVVS